MAEVNTVSKEGRKGRPTRMNLRVDFTPMVDMNLLLITFFMICTTLSKPQSMNLTLPSNDKENVEPPKVTADKAVTLILGEANKVYYYFGKPNYKDLASLKSTTYDADGLRKILLQRNAAAVKRMNELKALRQSKQISEVDFKERSKQIRTDEQGVAVMIKPTEKATYDNLVKVLDEMHICSVGRYTIMDVAEGDKFLMDRFGKKNI